MVVVAREQTESNMAERCTGAGSVVLVCLFAACSLVVQSMADTYSWPDALTDQQQQVTLPPGVLDATSMLTISQRSGVNIVGSLDGSTLVRCSAGLPHALVITQ